ncbi:MAG TPA: GIY-YIG nuclease family protein [Sphingobacterium sp.]|nr:GIY-YIG nuclease family protein [Sphingobacterium sp.]
MERGGCVYIITNYQNTTLYIGVTSDLQSQMYEHIHKPFVTSFSKKYNLYKLVYFNFFPTMEEAITEEKQLEGGSRVRKEELISQINPSWEDLYEKEVKHWQYSTLSDIYISLNCFVPLR